MENTILMPLEEKKSAIDLTELAIGIVSLGIVVTVGATILVNVGDTNPKNSTAYNISYAGAQGLAEYGNWFKILVIVGIAGGILGLIFMAFGSRNPEEHGGGGQY